MNRWTAGLLSLSFVALAPVAGRAQLLRYRAEDGRIRVAPVKMPYSGARNVPEINPNPAYLEAGGLVALLEELGAEVKPIPTVALTPEEEREYGEWHRLGLANAHLGRAVAENENLAGHVVFLPGDPNGPRSRPQAHCLHRYAGAEASA